MLRAAVAYKWNAALMTRWHQSDRDVIHWTVKEECEHEQCWRTVDCHRVHTQHALCRSFDNFTFAKYASRLACSRVTHCLSSQDNSQVTVVSVVKTVGRCRACFWSSSGDSTTMVRCRLCPVKRRRKVVFFLMMLAASSVSATVLSLVSSLYHSVVQ